MSVDFKANQIRINRVINSGSSLISPLLVYGVEAATNEQGGINLAHFPGLGSDVWLYVSGTRDVADQAYGAVAFRGDVVVSGALQIGDAPGAPGTPATGKGVIFARTGSLYFKDSLGNESDLTAGVSSAGGSDRQIQFNDGGSLNGDSFFTYLGGFVSLTGSLAHGDSGVDGPDASGPNSHAEGVTTSSPGIGSHAEGFSSISSGNGSHAEGSATTSSGDLSHAEGSVTTSSGAYSHAEGIETVSYGIGSHAEGRETASSGSYSHAEGVATVSYAIGSHAEGIETFASGNYSHAEGLSTIAIGFASHAEGRETFASGNYSHVSGRGTISSGSYQNVIGKYNKRSNDFSIFVIGDGTGDADANRGDIVRVNSGSSIGQGRVEVTGAFAATLGITGSLTKLVGGSDYLIAGANITLSTGSLGDVTISATGGDSYWQSTTSNVIFTTGSANATFLSSSAGLSVTGSSNLTGSLTLTGSLRVYAPDEGTINLQSSAGDSGLSHVSDGNLYLTNNANSGNLTFSATNSGGLGRQLLVLEAGSTTGNIFISGSTYVGVNSSDSLYVQARLASDVIPDGDRTRNLGSNSNRFANVYTGDLHLRNDRGDWTIVEESDFLRVVNNITGKQYKMVLQPID